MLSLRFQPQTSPYDKYVNISPCKAGERRAGKIAAPQFGYASSDSFSMTNKFMTRKISEKYKVMGDESARVDRSEEAILYYRKAIAIRPDYAQPYYNLARVYEKRGDVELAMKTYTELLVVKPDEAEAQTLIGKCYKEKGDYASARDILQKAVKTDPKYDFANRSLKEIDNLIIAQTDPAKAEAQRDEAAQKNMGKALELVNKYVSPETRETLKKVKIEFAPTDSLSGYQNIAQYENHNKRIVVTQDYLWAAPEITASYLVHEAVHAKDQDGLSSIKEEQDAYEASIKFWIQHSNGIKDPELDYAAGLYKESSIALKEKVADTYRSRDRAMPESSPNHVASKNDGLFMHVKLALLSTKDKCFSRKMPIN